jgi:hypothetical protein
MRDAEGVSGIRDSSIRRFEDFGLAIPDSKIPDEGFAISD